MVAYYQPGMQGRAPREDRLRGRLFAAGMLVSCVVIAGVIIGSINGGIGGSAGTFALPFSFSGNVGATLAEAIIVVPILVMVSYMIILMIRGTPRTYAGGISGSQKSNRMKIVIVVVMILIALIIIKVNPNNSGTPEKFTGSTSAGANPANQSLAGQGAINSIFETIVQTLFVPLVAALSFILLLFAYLSLKGRRKIVSVDAQRQRIADVVAEQIRSVGEGKDPRQAVIELYREMRDRLCDAGAIDRRTFTPREFGARASESLRLGTGTLQELTHLYEEAKFSIHPMSTRERDRALDFFGRIMAELTSTGGEVHGTT